MKRVYIAGPISKGDLAANINRASRAFERLALAGLAPFCPHWSCFSGVAVWERTYTYDPSSGEDRATGRAVFAKAGAQPNKLTHADWLRVDLAWVACADAVLRLPGESAGADQETAFARMNGTPVFEDEAALLRWARGA